MTILAYHAIDPGWRSPLSVHPERFAAQCAWLSRMRTVLPLERVLEHPVGPATALTFDDGFASVFDAAVATLRPMGLPATIFVITDTLTGDTPPTWLDHGQAPPTLSLDQILELRSIGFTFGSHTKRHHDLTTMDRASIEGELLDSRMALEDLLGEPVSYIAYPRGRFSNEVSEAARAAGYDAGFAMAQRYDHGDPRFQTPRYGVYQHDGPSMLRCKTSSWYPALRSDPRTAALRMRIGKAGRSRRRPARGLVER